jgi:DNA (cytosine-5)-methyltransferase 1
MVLNVRRRERFDVARIIRAKKPAIFVLENVKNLKSHDKGKTFKVIMETLDELGYEVADAADVGKSDPKVIDGKYFLPQHRERIVLVGFRRDLNIHKGFTLRDVSQFYPEQRPSFGELLEPVVDSKYILTRSSGSTSTTMLKSMRRRGMVSVLVSSILKIRKVLPERFLPAITKTGLKF